MNMLQYTDLNQPPDDWLQKGRTDLKDVNTDSNTASQPSSRPASEVAPNLRPGPEHPASSSRLHQVGMAEGNAEADFSASSTALLDSRMRHGEQPSFLTKESSALIPVSLGEMVDDFFSGHVEGADAAAYAHAVVSFSCVIDCSGCKMQGIHGQRLQFKHFFLKKRSSFNVHPLHVI